MSAKEPTAKAKAFIQNVARGLPTREAAIQAGYPEKSAASKGRQLACDHAAAIDKAVALRIGRKQGFALDIIVDLANNSENDRVRLDAAKDILNRGAHVTATRQIDGQSMQSLEQLIRALEMQLGPAQTVTFLIANKIPVPDRLQATSQPGAGNNGTEHDSQPETVVVNPQGNDHKPKQIESGSQPVN